MIYEDEERWLSIRQEVAMEIETRIDLYNDVLGVKIMLEIL